MIKDLINAIAEGDTLEIDRTFNSVMAHKISERLDSMRVDVAQSMFNSQMVEEGVASGEWHVTDELKGGIHSTHSSARKAKNMAEKLNAADYEQNKDDPSRTSGKLFHNRYAIQAASEPLSIWNKAAQKRQQNESEDIEEAVATQQMRDRDSLNRAFKKGDENAAKQGAKKEVKEYQTGPDGKQYLKSIRYESVQDTIED